MDAGTGTNSALLSSTQQPARGLRQAWSPPGKPLLAPSQLWCRWCPLSTGVADGHHLCGLCLGVSRAESPQWACRRSKKASRVVLGLVLSHLWAQPGHKDKEHAGVGGIPNALPGAVGGDGQEASSCIWWARAAQPGSRAGDVPRALHGACAAVISLRGHGGLQRGAAACASPLGWIPAAFDLSSLGKSLLFLEPQFDTSGPLGFSPSCACFLCRKMPCTAVGRVWLAHGGLSASCCTPNGGWSIAHPCTLFPSGSLTQALPCCTP